MKRYYLHQPNVTTSGFTILELMISLAIVAVLSAVALPNFDDWTLKRTIQNGYKEVADNLRDARTQALTQNTTARVLVSGTEGNYVMTAFLADSPTNTCTTTGTWNQIYSRNLSLSSAFEITGSAFNNHICFYRDRSSNGGTYSFAQDGGGTAYGAASIIISIATGYLDVSYTP